MDQPVVAAPARMNAMGELLVFLGTRCSFLFTPGSFRLVDSELTDEFGGNARVVLESRSLRLRFSSDRGQLLLELQPLDGKRDEWFSPGLLRGWLEGELGSSEVLDDEWAAFLATALPALEARLENSTERDGVLEELRGQARRRAKLLFG